MHTSYWPAIRMTLASDFEEQDYDADDDDHIEQTTVPDPFDDLPTVVVRVPNRHVVAREDLEPVTEVLPGRRHHRASLR